MENCHPQAFMPWSKRAIKSLIHALVLRYCFSLLNSKCNPQIPIAESYHLSLLVAVRKIAPSPIGISKQKVPQNLERRYGCPAARDWSTKSRTEETQNAVPDSAPQMIYFQGSYPQINDLPVQHFV